MVAKTAAAYIEAYGLRKARAMAQLQGESPAVVEQIRRWGKAFRSRGVCGWK